MGLFRSRTSPKAEMNFLLSRQLLYPPPFALVGTREAGERYAREYLYRAFLRFRAGAIFLMNQRHDWF